ncbi:hypothetical protein FOZ63_013076, partial [Perkinsus olseni]
VRIGLGQRGNNSHFLRQPGCGQFSKGASIGEGHAPCVVQFGRGETLDRIYGEESYGTRAVFGDGEETF